MLVIFGNLASERGSKCFIELLLPIKASNCFILSPSTNFKDIILFEAKLSNFRWGNEHSIKGSRLISSFWSKFSISSFGNSASLIAPMLFILFLQKFISSNNGNEHSAKPSIEEIELLEKFIFWRDGKFVSCSPEMFLSLLKAV